MSLQPSPPDDPTGLTAYFTDAEPLLKLFDDTLAAPKLSTHLINIHGVGGVGKTSVLHMFRLRCTHAGVPVGLASGEGSKSVVDILSAWHDGLKACEVKLPTFGATIEHYRALLRTAEAHVRKANAEGAFGKIFTKSAEATAGIALGATLGSLVPVFGTIAGAVGGAVVGTTAEALVDLLRHHFNKPDVELLLDPTRKLTDDFIRDLTQAAARRRIVLMLDAFERIATWDEWACSLAQRFQHCDVLLVIGGRETLNWGPYWPGWMAVSELCSVDAMPPEVMRQLVSNYCTTQLRGEPDAATVEEIVRFARGLPVAVTTAVRLWARYRFKNFRQVEAGAYHALVLNLRQGVPPKTYRLLEAAATLRYFNKEILRAVTPRRDVDAAYEELKTFPFTRSDTEGALLVFRVHDSIREFIDGALQIDEPDRHRELHTRAAAYFEARLAKAGAQDAEKLELERLYHYVRADEKTGLQVFQALAEEFVSFRRINRLRALLGDVKTYHLSLENSRLWRDYYNARLAHLHRHWTDAETVYRRLSESDQAEPKLRAYALCDWGHIRARSQNMGKEGGAETAIAVLERSLKVAPAMDSKLSFVYSYLRDVYIHLSEWEQAVTLLQKQMQFQEQNQDKIGVVHTLAAIKGTSALEGNWPKAFDAAQQGLAMLEEMPQSSFARVRFVDHAFWAALWTGRCAEAEQDVRVGLDFVRQMGDQDLEAGFLRDLGLTLGSEEKYDEAEAAFAESEKLQQDLGVVRPGTRGYWGSVLLRRGLLDRAENNLLASLGEKLKVHDNLGIPELYNWLGELNEMRRDWPEAESCFVHCLNFTPLGRDLPAWGRHHFECGALTGLVRVKYAREEYDAIPAFVVAAERLAQQYEYNEHLGSLRLMQGHTAWDGHCPEWGAGFDAAFQFYQQALVYALRYNRFLLDGILSGPCPGFPWQSLISYCMARGEQGRSMLSSLADWWKIGLNDVGVPRLDTISPIPEGIPLLRAECLAREREPGTGTAQATVVQQIQAGLR